MYGEAGFEKPQDCRVTASLKDSGGITVTLQSKMEGMFGTEMKRSARAVLDALGVRHAEVGIYDFGSLDFVIRARVRTAVRRAGGTKGGECDG